jgi:Glycine/sarcosine/betaine reductase selenoprotein B (GRDB)
MDYVRYIDKTRAYYASIGYEKSYEWAHFDDVPFARLRRPLSESRVALVSTSDIAIKSADDGSNPHEQFLVGSVYSFPSDTPVEDLYSPQEHYDVNATHLDDVNSYFPISRLRELSASGRCADIAPRAHGVYTAYSQRRTSEVDAPEVLQRCREDEVDAVVLVPI